MKFIKTIKQFFKKPKLHYGWLGKCCNNCLYFDIYYCRRKSPIVTIDSSGSPKTSWPDVHESSHNNWCGEWKKKIEGVK